MSFAGKIEVLVGPTAKGFWKKAEAQRGPTPTWNVDVEANLKRFRAEMLAERKRQEANAVNLRVHVDRASLRRSDKAIRQVIHTYSRSSAAKAIRINLQVVGAASLPALAKGIMSTVAAVTDLSRALLALPGLISGVAAAVGTAVVGMRGLSDAFSAHADSVKNSAQSMKQARDTAREYGRASRDLERAQRDVVKALKDANRQIEDQRDALTQGAISVEQAQLNVQKANERLARGGFESMTDWRQALLDQKQAYFDLGQAVKDNGRTVQDYYDNSGKAATQTDTFRDSLERLGDAVDRMTDAEQAAAGATDKFADAMGKLAPAARDFVNQMILLGPAWQRLQLDVAQNLFDGLGDSVTDLANRRMPLLQRAMGKVAAAINGDIKTAIESVGGDKNSGNIEKIFDRTAAALDRMRPGIDSLITAFVQLSEVGARFLPRLAGAFNRVMGRFEDFVDRADQDGSLERWIDRGLDAFASLGRSMGQIGSIFGSVTRAYEAATGNVGGLVSSLERGLTGLAEYLSSDRGQNALRGWITQAVSFIDSIREAIPGIAKLFSALGEGARQFAEVLFPRLAQLGNFLNDNATLVKNLIAAWIGFRTVQPILKQISKFGEKLRGGRQHYRNWVNDVRAARQVHLDASAAIGKAKAEQEAYAKEVRNSTAALQRAKSNHAAYVGDVAAAQGRLADASRNLADAQARYDKQAYFTNKAINKQGVESRYTKGQITLLKKRTEDLSVAQAGVSKASKDVSDAFRRHDVASQNTIGISQRLKAAKVGLSNAISDVKTQTALADEAGKKAASGGFARLKAAIGARNGGGLAGVLGALTGVMGGVITLIGSVGATAGLIYAFDQWTAANERSEAAVRNHKAALDELEATLEKGTGSATNATLEQNVKALTNYQRPQHPDDENQRFDAIKTLQDQGYLPAGPAGTAKAAQLTTPTEYEALEAFVKPGVDEIAKAVPNIPNYRDFVTWWKDRGIDERTYAEALTGNREAIGKVKAARLDMFNIFGVAEKAVFLNNPNVAARLGSMPNDLGTAQEQLDRSGPGRGPSGLAESLGALRHQSSGGIDRGAELRRQADARPQPGLNRNGLDKFGGFVLGPAGAVINPDGSGIIEVDNRPDQAWIDDARDKGITVRDRAGSGATIEIDADAVPKYFNPVPKFSAGGSVWGAGTSTSDSIPARLSNGEFVVNAKAAKAIGHDRLSAMNRGGLVPGFAEGGLIGGAGGAPPSPRKPIDLQPGQTPFDVLLTTPKPVKAPFAIGGAGDGASYKPLIPKTPVGGLLSGDSGPSTPLNLGGARVNTPESIRSNPLAKVFSPEPILNAVAPPTRPPFTGPVTPLPFNPQHGPGAGPAADLGQRNVHGTGTEGGFLPGPKSEPSSTTSGGTQSITDPGLTDPGATLTLPDGSSVAPPGGPSTPAATPVAPATSSTPAVPPGVVPPQPSGPPPAAPPPSAYAGYTPSGRAQALKDFATSIAGRVPYVWGGYGPNGMDCTGLALAMANIAQGKGPFDVPRDFWTGNAGVRLAERGFLPGAGGPGSITIGWNDTHAGVTLPDGTRIDAQSEDAGIVMGEGSPGASGFPNVMHFPVDPTAPSSYAGPYVTPDNPLFVPPAAAGGGPGGIPGVNAPIQGPFGPVPFQPFDFLREIGTAILQGILGFFGINISGIIGPINSIIDGVGGLPGLQTGPAPQIYGTDAAITDPGPDLSLVDDLNNQADYYDSIGQPDMANNLRKAASDYKNRAVPSAPTAASNVGPLTVQSDKNQVAAYILAEAKKRGYSTLQAQAILSTALQESGLSPSASGGGGAWHGIFQQDTSYPGRDDPNQNIQEFFNRLGSKGGPQSEDIWKSIFWLQQRPGEASAASAYANGRQHYLTEIQSRMGESVALMQAIGYAGGGHVKGPGTGTSDSIPAMLSSGEYVMRAAAVKKLGVGRLNAMNALKFSDGGVVPPIPPIDPNIANPPTDPIAPPLAAPSTAGDAPGAPVAAPEGGQPTVGGQQGLQEVGQALGGIIGAKGGGGGGQSGGGYEQEQPSDPRAILAAAPTSSEHNLPALSSGIKGAFNTIGALAGSAAAAGLGAANIAAPGAGSAAGGAASQLISAGAQMAGDIAAGAVNVLSSLGVGNVTPSRTGAGYGAPLLPSAPQQPQMRNFQSIHNGDIQVANMDEYSRMKDRKDAQRALPFMNRVNA